MLGITDNEFRRLAEYVKAHYGIHLREEKRPLVVGRLQHVVADRGMSSFTEYMDEVEADKTGMASRQLVDRITTNHTFFMRETEHFRFFKEQALPFLYGSIKDKDLRIWSAGCSSGEEPYTLAMLVDEFFGPRKAGWDTKILATDISARVLETAKRGLYANEAIAPLPAAWRSRYFRKAGEGRSAIDPKLAEEVIFRKFNLMDPMFPFKRKFHVIFCRNVMIYFDNATKEKLVDKFYGMLEPGGYLFIGQSESISRDSTRFRYVMPSVYRK